MAVCGGKVPVIFNITSSKNEKFKYFKSLKTKKARSLNEQFAVEGIKSVRDAIGAGADIDAILVSAEFYEKQSLDIPTDLSIYVIGNEIFASLSDTEAPQGIIAVINQREKELLPDLQKAYIYCDKIQDPGNLGTIIRTADAAGFGGVILSDGCVEMYNPKTVRASMGSFFNIDVFDGISADRLLMMKSLGFSVVCGVLSDNSVCYTDADFTKPTVVVVGNEANGISDEVKKLSDVDIKIPIDGAAESLNAAIAAAIIMYEVNRQRK